MFTEISTKLSTGSILATRATTSRRAASFALLTFGLACVAPTLLAQAPTASAPAPAVPSVESASAVRPYTALPDAPSAAAAPPSTAPVEKPFQVPRNFRITPAASRTNVPGKIAYYLHSTWSVRNLLEAYAVMGTPYYTTPPVQPAAPTTDDPAAAKIYQQEMDAYGDAIDTWANVNEANGRYYGRRFAVGLGTAETRQLFSNLVLPLALHQDARFIPLPPNSGFGDRMVHAAESIVLTTNDHGATVPNYSKLGGTIGAAIIGKTVYAPLVNAPELNSGHFVMHYIGYSLLGDLATNAAREMIDAAISPDLDMYNLHGRSTDDAYYPLSAGGKVLYWARSTYAPRNFIQAAIITGLPATHHQPKEPSESDSSTWQGAPNYDTAYNNFGRDTLAWKDREEENLRYHARRLAGGFSEVETQALLQNLVLPIAFDMDPRYVPLGPGYSVGSRLSHAFQGIVVTHNDAGKKRINLPVLGGTVGAAYMAKELYYPQLGTPALESNRVLATTIGLNLAGDVIYNVFGEFLRHRGY